MAYRSAAELQYGFWRWLFDTPQGQTANGKYMDDVDEDEDSMGGWDVSDEDNVKDYMKRVTLEQARAILDLHGSLLTRQLTQKVFGYDVYHCGLGLDYSPFSSSLKAFAEYLVHTHMEVHEYNGG